MRLAGLFLLAGGALFAPLALDAWDATEVGERIAAQSKAQAERLEPRRAEEGGSKLIASLGLGKPLPSTLFLLTDLAAKAGLATPMLQVQPPTPLARESGDPVLSEHKVRLITRGLPRAVHRFVQTLPELAAPLRIEAARLSEPPGGDGMAQLDLDLRVLVELD